MKLILLGKIIRLNEDDKEEIFYINIFSKVKIKNILKLSLYKKIE